MLALPLVLDAAVTLFLLKGHVGVSSEQELTTQNMNEPPVEAVMEKKEEIEQEKNVAVTSVINSIVQIEIVYTDANGESYVLSNGTGFMINDYNVVTSFRATWLTSEEMEIVEEFFDIDQKKLMERLSTRVRVSGDVSVLTKTVTNSDRMNFAVLELRTKISNLDVLPLRYSKNINLTQECYCVGYSLAPHVLGNSMSSLKPNAIVTSGNINQIVAIDDVKYYKCGSSSMEVGEGGALIDRNGNVIGIRSLMHTADGEKSDFIAVVVDPLIETLDRLGIMYQNNSN